MLQQTTRKDDIRPLLVKYLTEGKKKIQLAIGWIDDTGLIGLLQKKALEGVMVQLLLIKDKKSTQNKAMYAELIRQGVQITWLKETYREKLIDYKFGVIDEAIALTGNYNWGHQNAPKEEFLKITEGVPTFSKGYAEEFDFLTVVNQLAEGETRTVTALAGLLKKLDILKVLLNIGDTEFIHLRLKELENFPADENVDLIYQALLNKKYEEALLFMQAFIDIHQSLRDCIDPPIDRLRREIQRLEEEIAEVSNEFNETQKTLHKFSKQHSETLGDLLQKILLQNKIKAEIEAKAAQDDEEKQEEYEEAKRDHEEYTKSHEQAKKEKLAVLTPEEQKELKKLYRQTSLKCHPDRVVEEMQEQAEALFVELNQAYKANNLERLREISKQLKAGIMLSKSESITELKKLESTIGALTQKLNSWVGKLEQLQGTPSYKTINGIADWDNYFEETKTILLEQLERLMEFNEAADKTKEEISLLE